MSAIPPARIKAVRFHIAGSEENARKSFVDITEREPNDGDRPRDGGIEDLHMGTTDSEYLCKTCGRGKQDCLGHPGAIRLRYPVINPITIEYLVRWLKIVCHNCSRMLVPAAHYRHIALADRMAAVIQFASRVSGRVCGHCHTQQYTIMRKSPTERPLEITGNLGTVTKMVFYPHVIETIFSKIRDEDCMDVMGSTQSHPRNYILRTMIIPPVTTRPAVRKTNGSKSTNDDITQTIQVIVGANAILPEVIPEIISDDLHKYIYGLNMHVYTMIRGSASSGAAMSIGVSLKGKPGVIRNNLLGKRVFNAARSTIVGDHSIPINALGVPLRFAQIVEIEEIVQHHNRARLLSYVRNAKARTYPAAMAVIKASTGVRYSTEYMDISDIENGDRIMRNVIDGDIVLFNRQPTLTISNISAHRVIVLRDPNSYAIRVNVCVTPLYNADFDGDAMHIIFVTTEAARVELRYLSMVDNWFTLHTTSGPAMGQVDDGVVGMAELTRDSTRFNRYHAMQVFAHARRLPSFTEETYSGRDLISLLLEPTPVNITRTAKIYDEAKCQYIDYSPTETAVNIVGGELRSGVLDKSTIGKGATGGLYHVLANEYNAEIALGAMHDMQAMVIAYLEQRGYSIGLLDVLPSPEAQERIHQATADTMAKARQIASAYISGHTVASFGETQKSMFETQLKESLKHSDSHIDALMRDIDPRYNGLYALVATGSKGSQQHMLNMMACVGQKLLDNSRTAEKFGYGRTSVYSRRFSTEPIDGGYIANSMIVGMNSHEFIANASASRFDLTLKALSTSVTGEQSRKSIKCLESQIVDNHRRVLRSSSTDMILELVAGDNYADTRYLENVKLPTIAQSDEQIATEYGEWAPAVRADRDTYRRQFMQLESLRSDGTMIPTVRSLFNIDRIIANCTNARGEAKDLTPAELKLAIAYAEGQITDFGYTYLHPNARAGRWPILPHMVAAAWLPQMILRTRINPKSIAKLRLDVAILQVIFGNVQLAVLHGMIVPGTLIGIIAAQAFSEPFTQYMLDAHHRSATGGSSFDSVNAVRALLGAKSVESLTNPRMFLCVRPEYEADKAAVTKIANNIETITLRDFVDRYQVFFEAYGKPKHPDYVGEAESVIAAYQRFNPLMTPPGDLINYCIRFVINKQTLLIKGMPIELLVTRLREEMPGLHFVYTLENDPQVIIRAYIRSGAIRAINPTNVTAILQTLLGTMVRGVPGILATAVEKAKRSVVMPDGSLGTKEIWIIKTRGTNFIGVIGVPEIDPRYVMTDSVQEIAKYIGIVAARQQIINILKDLIPSSELINWSHFMLYADEMTSTGTVTAIEQQGVDTRDPENIYLRMGFTAPLTKIIEAGIGAVRTKIDGVTPSLMVGTVPKAGTNYDTYVANPEFIRANVKSADTVLDSVFG